MSSVRLETRIQALLDGVLPDDQRAELLEALSSSEEARRLYCRYARLHTALQFRSREIQSREQLPGPVIAFNAPPKRRQIQVARSRLMAIAAVIVLGLVPLWLLFAPKQPPVAVFETAPGTHYSLTHEGKGSAEGDRVLDQGSRLTVSQGTVALTFASGVHSVLVAPSSIVVQDAASLLINEGEAWIHVPEAARGFRVKTGVQDIVDLGTEFAVRAGVDVNQLHVIQGAVKVTSLQQPNESETLFAGEARHSNSLGQLVEIPYEPSGFLTRLPDSIVRFEGALDLAEGTHALGQGGVTYSVSEATMVVPNCEGVEGNLVIHGDGALTLEFSDAVDLRITPPSQVSYGSDPNKSAIWNSFEDYGQFTCAPDAEVTLLDPEGEIRLEQVAEGLYRWEFLVGNEALTKLPSYQAWAIEVTESDRFSISKHRDSSGRAAFKFQVVSPSAR
jgi:hypothetical protein